MTATAYPRDTTFWIDGARAHVAEAIIEAMDGGVAALGIGGPRETAVDQLARRLDKPRLDDLRQLLVEYPAEYLVVATMTSLSAKELEVAAQQQTTVLTLEPIAASLAERVALGLPMSESSSGLARATLPRLVDLPAFLEGPGFRRATDPDQSLGHGRLVSFTSFALPEHGSLFARMLDAWRAVLGFSDVPESIDASLAGALAVPDDLRRATGRLAAHARMPDGSGAAIAVTDRAGQAGRRLEAVADDTHLTVTDGDYALTQIGGQVIDDYRDPDGPLDYVSLVADQWRRLMERPAQPRDATDALQHTRALACCEASLLSARTRQAENPRKLMEMHR